MTHLSSKICPLGAFRSVLRGLGSYKPQELTKLLSYDERSDLLLAGSLKTLLPSLKYVGKRFYFEYGC
ncbi:MAG: hypothetical protein ACFFG0_23910 [Candidatus Thorarchaeota archaeon]